MAPPHPDQYSAAPNLGKSASGPKRRLEMSAIPPLSGDKQTSEARVKNDAHDPKATWPITSRLSRRAPKSPFRALDFSVKMLTSRCLRLAARSHRWVERRRDGRSAPSRSSQKKCRELPFSRRPRLPDRNTHKHSFEGLPIWAASKVTTLPLSGDGAVAQRNSSPGTRP